MDTGFVVAILIAAVLVYDRLGGNDELSRRLFQVGLAISLSFLVLSATAAFFRTGGIAFGGGASGAGSDSDRANRIVSATAVQYAVGIVFLVAGMAMLRRYHTLPLGFVLGGVLLLFMGGTSSGATAGATLARLGIDSSQTLDVVTFATAAGGTLVLIAYGAYLEREFARDAQADEDEREAASTG